MTNIAVIGAGGFVGTRLVESLVLDGQTEVRAVVRAYRSLAPLSRFGSAITVRIADAEDATALVPALRGVSVVVNVTTGAPAGIMRSTRAIAGACLAAGVPRLVHLSSAVVYGEDFPASLPDDAPPAASHWMAYARAKAAAEVWLRERLPMPGCQVVVLRPGIVWGAGSPHTLNVVRSLLDKTAYMVDDGRGIFNGVYIDNLVACIRACGAAQGDVTGLYNVSDDETVTWRDFYAAFAPCAGYSMSAMPSVSGTRFPWSARAVVDYIQSLALVNAAYHRLKSRLPDQIKSSIKAVLSDSFSYETPAATYAKPVVDRELWHLQKVKNKLPNAKFARRFLFTPPVEFEEGVRRTLRWLAFLGLISNSRTREPAEVCP